MVGLRIAAPGKLFLAGEYAVLDAVPAVVAAVPVWGRYTGAVQPRRVLGCYPGAPAAGACDGAVDTRAFFRAGRKQGFGSSAVASVLFATLLERGAAGDIWANARGEHEGRSQGGSGGDLAAAIHGGVGVYRLLPEGYAWQPVAWPAAAELVVVDSGQSSRTADWVVRYRAAAGAADTWRREVAAAVARVAAGDWSAGMHAAAACYRELGRWLGDGFWPSVFDTLAAVGRNHDLPFKPSGAGGGDIALYYASQPDAAAGVVSELRRAGFAVRRMRPTGRGVHWWTVPDGAGGDAIQPS